MHVCVVAHLYLQTPTSSLTNSRMAQMLSNELFSKARHRRAQPKNDQGDDHGDGADDGVVLVVVW